MEQMFIVLHMEGEIPTAESEKGHLHLYFKWYANT